MSKAHKVTIVVNNGKNHLECSQGCHEKDYPRRVLPPVDSENMPNLRTLRRIKELHENRGGR